ncbi:MAG: ATP-binding cassette domain-containing protein [Rickettsiales bacterium]|jgi:Fe-S cluster assembly ATP-binding protein|nr:ATP-binding cassette domain-containing protein [Rickettsiales bacterium]
MLQVENLSVSIAGKSLLNNVSLSVATGARAVLRGANGAGKTTLVNAILGDPDYEVSGRIIFDGADITKLKTDARARAGLFVGQQVVPEIPGLSVMTFLKHSYMSHFGDRPMGEFMTALKAAAAALDIPDAWLGRSVNVGFSGGEKKRLSFLRLLLIRPKMAVLDEMDSGADLNARTLFGKIIDDMKETTFLVITHQDVFFKATDEISF